MRTTAHNYTLPASLAALPFDLAAAPATLACHSGINETDERGWLAELYRGGRLLRLRRVPASKDRAPRGGEYHEWPEDEELAGEWLSYAIEHNHAHDDLHVWRPYLRARISGFSRQSRMRLLYKLNSIASVEAPLCPKFVTLTYPRDLLPSAAWAKRQLHAFCQAMFKRYGNFPLIWRMEYQEDGAVHFHLLCWFTPFLPWWWVAAEWDGLIGNQVAPRDSASTQVRAMKGWRQTAYYVSKYIAKDDEASYWDQTNGRHWGCRFWRLLPVHRVLLPLSEREGYALRRWTRRYRLAKGVRTRQFAHSLDFCAAQEIGLTSFMPERDIVRMLELSRGRSPLPPLTLVLPLRLTRRRAGVMIRAPEMNTGGRKGNGRIQSVNVHPGDSGETGT